MRFCFSSHFTDISNFTQWSLESHGFITKADAPQLDASASKKGALSWYGKLTWESAHAWNLIILCLLIGWGMTFIFMVHLSFYAIPLLIYDVRYDITTIP